MEGGSKNKISLESPLDIKTSDMLAPISQPKFQHNRQKFQGKCLPTSLRYELDGWAAGWEVYQFEFESTPVDTNPKGYIVVKQGLDGRGAYIIIFQKKITELITKDIISLLYNGISSFSESNITTTEGAGYTTIASSFNGKPFTIKVSPLTKKYTIEGVNFELETFINEVGDYTFIVSDLDTLAQFELKYLHAASSASSPGLSGAFADFESFDGNIYVWKDKAGTNSISIGLDGVVTANGKPAYSHSNVGNKHKVQFEGVYNQDVLLRFDTLLFCPTLRRLFLSKQLQGFYDEVIDTDIIDSIDFAQWDCRLNNPKNLVGGTTTYINGWLPYWYGIAVRMVPIQVDIENLITNDIGQSKFDGIYLVKEKVLVETPSWTETPELSDEVIPVMILLQVPLVVPNLIDEIGADGNPTGNKIPDLSGTDGPDPEGRTVKVTVAIGGNDVDIDVPLMLPKMIASGSDYILDPAFTNTYTMDPQGRKVPDPKGREIPDPSGATTFKPTGYTILDGEYVFDTFICKIHIYETQYYTWDTNSFGNLVLVKKANIKFNGLGKNTGQFAIRFKLSLESKNKLAKRIYNKNLTKQYDYTKGYFQNTISSGLKLIEKRIPTKVKFKVKVEFCVITFVDETVSTYDFQDAVQLSVSPGPVERLSEGNYGAVLDYYPNPSHGFYGDYFTNCPYRYTIPKDYVKQFIYEDEIDADYIDIEGSNIFLDSNGNPTEVLVNDVIDITDSIKAEIESKFSSRKINHSNSGMYWEYVPEAHQPKVTVTVEQATLINGHIELTLQCKGGILDKKNYEFIIKRHKIKAKNGDIDCSDNDYNIAAIYKSRYVDKHRVTSAACIQGYFQAAMTMNDLLTISNVNNKVTFRPSTNDELIKQGVYYIDRKDYVYKGKKMSEKLVGFELATQSINERTGYSAQLTLTEEPEFTVFTPVIDRVKIGDKENQPKLRDFYMPSHILNVDISFLDLSGPPKKELVAQGIKFGNLKARRLYDDDIIKQARFQIKAQAKLYNKILRANPIYEDKGYAGHDFFNNVLTRWIKDVNAVVEDNTGTYVSELLSDTYKDIKYVFDEDGVFSATQKVKYNVAGQSIQLEYILHEDDLKSETNKNINDSGYVGTITLKDLNFKLDTVYNINVPLIFDVIMWLPFVDNHDTKVVEYIDKKYVLERKGVRFTVNTTNNKLEYETYTTVYEKGIDDNNNDTYKGNVDYIAKRTFTGKVKGPFGDVTIIDSSVTDAKIVKYDGSSLTVSIDGKEYAIDISDNGLMNPDIATNMLFNVVDTRDENIEQKTIAKQNSANEFQLLKQQWNTTEEVENYWWIDSEHILELNEYNFVLKKKTEDIDDWAGDVWKIVEVFDRTDIIVNDVYKYGCTSAYGQTNAYLYTAKISDNGKIVLGFFNPLKRMEYGQVELDLVKRAIGEKLNVDTKILNTYADMSVLSLVTNSAISATSIGNYILFGIHFDNNFNQWALRINKKSFEYSILQGYGFVGVNGNVTGGQIPVKYFGNSGFTGTVMPLDFLRGEAVTCVDINTLYKLEKGPCIVGTAEQQWYIDYSIHGIVSHCNYTDNKWVPVTLPITNTLAQVYGSPSFATRRMTDVIAMVRPIMDMFSTTTASGENAQSTVLINVTKVAFGILGNPTVYGINPKINTAMYLQQTFGQYAYVHYNSTSIKKFVDLENKDKSDNVSSDELSFNKRTLMQNAGVLVAWDALVAIVMQALVSGAEFISEKLQVNAQQNQSATSDTGRKYSQIFLSNMEALASIDNNIAGPVPSVNSKVTGLLTLDMFYSTSDKQQVYAGPGFVNHNFQAQCVSQSIVSNQFELNQIAILLIFSPLTIAQAKLTYELLMLGADLLEKTAQYWSTTQGPTGMGSGPGSVMYTVVAVGLAGTANAMRAGAKVQQIAIEHILPLLLKGLHADDLQISVANKQSKHIYNIEGKHNYGTKSECFMWPCFGINDGLDYTDEIPEAIISNSPWNLNIGVYSGKGIKTSIFFGSVVEPFPQSVTEEQPKQTTDEWNGAVSYHIANVRGTSVTRKLPSDMAMVVGADTFLSKIPFKNENIDASEPVFPTPPFQDYIVDKIWQISRTASAGMTTWVSCKDTKLFDGEPSNFVISSSFCGVACPYTAIEVKRGISRRYLRPWAITPTAIGLNNTGYNCCYDKKVYHAFDGHSYRIVKWVGSAGMAKERQTWQYCFIVNDRFKRSNKMPLNEFIGNFKSTPISVIRTTGEDRIFNLVTKPGENEGMQAGTIGEDKDVRRYSLPVFSEFVSTLPAVVKTISAYNLSVVDGITTLTSENRDLQTAYKAPISIDFAIGKSMYRYTNEYICTLEQTSGVTVVKDTVPCLGLKYIGSTPYEAYLYSPATRQYYSFSGGSSLNVVDMIERFRNVTAGRYDFVNQEVLMPCLATFMRLDKKVLDDENETDNLMIARLKDSEFKGEVWPPTENIFNTRSWFRTVSMPMGIVYQGPNRCIVNRFVLSDYMVKSIKENYGKWKRVPREEYHPFREYKAVYESVDKDIGKKLMIKGWTHNPFLLVTAPLGVDNETDCVFEWEITFCWPVEMDQLYDTDNFATVNIIAETMTPGGKVVAERPTHVYLHKELFTRTGDYGYYSFRYQSKNGAGNRERLHIWSDQYIAISSLQCEYKVITSKRNEILTQQVDVQHLKEI